MSSIVLIYFINIHAKHYKIIIYNGAFQFVGVNKMQVYYTNSIIIISLDISRIHPYWVLIVDRRRMDNSETATRL